MSERPIVGLLGRVVDRLETVKRLSGIIDWEKEIGLAIEDIKVAKDYLAREAE